MKRQKLTGESSCGLQNVRAGFPSPHVLTSASGLTPWRKHVLYVIRRHLSVMIVQLSDFTTKTEKKKENTRPKQNKHNIKI